MKIFQMKAGKLIEKIVFQWKQRMNKRKKKLNKRKCLTFGTYAYYVWCKTMNTTQEDKAKANSRAAYIHIKARNG